MFELERLIGTDHEYENNGHGNETRNNSWQNTSRREPKVKKDMTSLLILVAEKSFVLNTITRARPVNVFKL